LFATSYIRYLFVPILGAKSATRVSYIYALTRTIKKMTSFLRSKNFSLNYILILLKNMDTKLDVTAIRDGEGTIISYWYGTYRTSPNFGDFLRRLALA
jgi:hypothetical protein